MLLKLPRIGQLSVRRTNPDSCARGIIATLIVLVASIGYPSFSQSQSLYGESTDPTKDDALYIREISRIKPEFAKDLKKDLLTADTPDARRKVLDRYLKRNSAEHKYSKFEDIVSFYISPTIRTYNMIGLMQGKNTFDPDEARALFKNFQSFENQIIKDIGFKDVNEMYSLFRELYPFDAGLKFLQEAKNLLDKGVNDEYLKRLDRISNMLKNFRAETMPPSESILPELTPFSPVDRSKPAKSSKKSQSASPNPAPSPCEQICNGQPNAQARAMCKANCSDRTVKP